MTNADAQYHMPKNIDSQCKAGENFEPESFGRESVGQRSQCNIVGNSDPSGLGRVGDCLLSTTYFGPVQWYQKLCCHREAYIEVCESYQKQTYRNRCLIATTQGVQALTVPVEHTGSSDRALTRDMRISDHGNWRHLHWHALMSAYSLSPFYEYYIDDLRPFFERRWTYLIDFNEAILHTMIGLLDIEPSVKRTDHYAPADTLPPTVSDFRETIRPKHPAPDATFEPRPYYQVFASKHGFLPNLSVLDLLFNMGPEAPLWLVGNRI